MLLDIGDRCSVNDCHHHHHDSVYGSVLHRAGIFFCHDLDMLLNNYESSFLFHFVLGWPNHRFLTRKAGMRLFVCSAVTMDFVINSPRHSCALRSAPGYLVAVHHSIRAYRYMCSMWL